MPPVHIGNDGGDQDKSGCQNMVSNLPLLFAGGYPTTLDKMTENQIENFIPFMVQCSLGYIQLQSNRGEYREPEWWPDDVPFVIPLMRPKDFSGDWRAKLREIVVTCYSFHKNIFLLRFCKELATYEPECLRFINNYNSTTSLFDRTNNKLLVTFRNENMLYDQQQISNKKTLLPRNNSSQSLDSCQQMVEPALFDIYLCDNCDAELYSMEAFMEHEKICQPNEEEGEDDDVIFCESEAEEPVDEDQQQMSAFLMSLGLQSTENIGGNQQSRGGSGRDMVSTYSAYAFSSPDKHRNFQRRTRGRLAYNKCQAIPISSPAGQLLLNTSKTVMSCEYLEERLDRQERFCIAQPLGGETFSRRRWLDSRRNLQFSSFPVTYRKLSDHQSSNEWHTFKFPKRQFSTEHRRQNLERYNAVILKQCKPCVVRVEKLTREKIEAYLFDANLKVMNKKLMKHRDKVHKRDNPKVVEIIDLCSSDDSGDEEERKAISEEPAEQRPDAAKESSDMSPKYDGNFISMPVQTVGLPAEPLKPSVFLFSNNTATSIDDIHSTQIYRLPTKIHQNQENIMSRNFWHTSSKASCHFSPYPTGRSSSVGSDRKDSQRSGVVTGRLMPPLIRLAATSGAKSITANVSI
uniref:Nuclear respiratory factor 1 NLS/DNA-binding dimerisation domain-containing protein n=1 Tax=Lutzomyia longipalpis TaxID=7200 RepID=A0A7G3AF49_LUTLO